MSDADLLALGPAETRILGVERSALVLDSRIFALRQRLTALEQGIWDAWSEVRVPAQAATPAPTPSGPSFPAICSSFPSTLTAVDAIYGNCTLTWNAGTGTWTGCRVVSSNPDIGLGCFTSVSTAVWYTLTGSNSSSSWQLEVQWVGVSAGGCPTTSTCSSTPNSSATASATILCTGTTVWNFTSGQKLWGGSGQLRITL